MDVEEFIADLKSRHDAISYANHPFLRDMIAGTLPLRAIGGWVIQNGYHLAGECYKEFCLFALRIPDRKIKKSLIDNLAGEVFGIRGVEAHWSLALRLAVACGWDEAEARAEPILPETDAITNYCVANAVIGSAEAVMAGVTLGGEGPFGPLSPKIARSLRENYKLDKHQTEYVWEHEEADAEHAETGWDMVRAYATDARRQAEIRGHYERMTLMFWEYYDGCTRAYVQGRKPGYHSRV
ncbi:MAG: TenA family transcriptional regulator [Gammaproteobacteria bacterium]